MFFRFVALFAICFWGVKASRQIVVKYAQDGPCNRFLGDYFAASGPPDLENISNVSFSPLLASWSKNVVIANAPDHERMGFLSTINTATNAVFNQFNNPAHGRSGPLEPKVLRDVLLPTLINLMTPPSGGLRSVANLQRFQSFSLFESTTFQILDSDEFRNPRGARQASMKWLKRLELDIVSIDDDEMDLVEEFSNHPCVEYAEVAEDQEVTPFELEPVMKSSSYDQFLNSRFMDTNFLARASLSITPNDNDFSKQWHLQASNFTDMWQEWRGPPSHDFVVAVIDTGCDTEHPDLKGRFWKNPGEICDNGIDDDGNGYIDDCWGYNFAAQNANLTEETIHGTAVSGAITANTNNNYGIAGACWWCKIMCARIGAKALNVAAFVEAMNYAMGWGVKVANYSGSGAKAKAHETAIAKALEFDALVVTAAGNDACDLDGPDDLCPTRGYPGRIDSPNTINVAALTNKNERASYTNFGKSSVDIFAPSGLYLPRAAGTFSTVSGTSFSAPTVAAAVALLWSYKPTLRVDQIRSAILQCSQNASLQELVACGGSLSVTEALKKAELYP